MDMLPTISEYIKDVSVLRRILFAVAQLPPDLPNIWGIAVEFATKGKEARNSISAKQAQLFMDNLHDLDAAAFQSDEKILLELIEYRVKMPKPRPLGIVLISNNNKCLLCRSKLQLRKDRPATVLVYDDQMGTLPGSHFHKYCVNALCGFTQYYGYYSTGGDSSDIFFVENWHTLPFFVSSRETAFSMSLVERISASILIGQQSFMQCADLYNYLNKDSNKYLGVLERQNVDRRRIEQAFFQYALLKVVAWYPDKLSLSTMSLHSKTTETLPQVVAVYHGAFMRKYAGHQCTKPGCKNVLVLDGNMKNHRFVCSATHAGYIAYNGLSGKARSGCQNTPAYKSSYCELHKPVLAMPQRIQLEDEPGVIQITAEEPVGIIINKRKTRHSTLYQVAWLGRSETDTSWEPESTLPKSLIQDFEQGVSRTVEEHTFSSGGQIHRTVTTKVQYDQSHQPSLKRIRPCTSIDCASSGIFNQTNDPKPLKCNTEKDKTRVRHHTAGILAGTRPCGTIVMIGELFGAESKSQVYGNVHTYFHDNPNALHDLEYIVYDDACHLKRYACNPIRCKETTTTATLADKNFVVDKFHFPGHVDSWCQEHCNPNKFDDLQKVDTEACEQLFSWLSRYARITQHMNREHFLFYILYLCDQRNRNITK